MPRLIEARSGTPLGAKKSSVSLYESTMPWNLYAPHSNSTTGGIFLASGIMKRATFSVKMRTSCPLSVVSKTRSMVSLAVLWLTYCLVLLPLPFLSNVLLTVYCSDTGLKWTSTALPLSGPDCGTKRACLNSACSVM